MFDRVASIIFIALGVSLFFYSGTLTTSLGGSIGPKEMPMFLSIALTIAAVINLIMVLKLKPVSNSGKNLDHEKFLKIIFALVAYIFLLEPLGYVLSTFLFLMFAIQTMERVYLWKSALVAGVFSGGIYYLYVKVALGSLPGFPFID